MKISFDRSITNDIDLAMRREWIETNGLGGWASSTIIGLNTRKYHGLLVAAMNPPTGRFVLLSKLDETIIHRDRRMELGCNSYPGVIHPNGDQFLESFDREWMPSFTYMVDGIRIQKKIFAVHGQNTTVILYDVLTCNHEFEMELQPFVACRDYHSLMEKNDQTITQALFSNGQFRYEASVDMPGFSIFIPGASYQPRPDWYLSFEYVEELERGLDFQEDLFSPGVFKVKLGPGSLLGLVISTETASEKDPFKLYEQEMQRRRGLLQPFAQQSSFIKTLVLAADQFVVKRGDKLNSIIAGYPWFSDWGRDAMISLPGLCLTTGRHDTAKKIIAAFSDWISEGMLPNRFPDEGNKPEYNTADATLWFFVTVYRYWLKTGDHSYIQNNIYPLLKDIIGWHDRGTRYNIHTDHDGLLIAGTAETQLTWMDVKFGDWVVTPRQGKAVEINALWYNAMRIVSAIADKSDETEDAEKYARRADQIQSRFESTFWNDETHCLYDYVDEEHRDASIRPNQLFAISLPFPLINGDRAKRVMDVIDEHLFTPFGLRSLSPKHPDYRGVYEGDLLARDSAYHQGTVWSWLIGPYITALVKTRSKPEVNSKLALIRKNMQEHLLFSGVGTVSEIFDGNAPHKPRGCIAQAWSVAELLRVLLDESGET